MSSSLLGAQAAPWMFLAPLIAANACGRPTLPATADPAQVKEFFSALGERPGELSSEAEDLAPGEKHALKWLMDALSSHHKIPRSSEGHVQMKAIQELFSSKKQAFAFRLSKATPRSPGAYALQRHRAQGFVPLSPSKNYIQVQYVPKGLACPEYHGVVDLENLKLISFWVEGG